MFLFWRIELVSALVEEEEEGGGGGGLVSSSFQGAPLNYSLFIPARRPASYINTIE